MARRRSVVYYIWIGVGIQVAFLIGAAGFILAGALSQGAAITAADEVSRLELSNLSMRASFLYAQQALRGYQITGKNRFLQSYYAYRFQYTVTLGQARALAWPQVLPDLENQARTAATAFGLADQIVAAPHGSARANALFNRATVASDQYVTQDQHTQDQLFGIGSSLTAASQRALGTGVGATAAALAIGVLVPFGTVVILLRRSIAPLRATTQTVRRLAHGDHSARAFPAGPAETWELATSINHLADENDRLRAAEEERKRLQAAIRKATMRIRRHLQAGAITREAVTDLTKRQVCDRVWLVLMRDGKLTLPEGNRVDNELAAVLARDVPVYRDAGLVDLYRSRGSRVIDLLSPENAVFPPELREVMVKAGGRHLLVIPFGTGRDPLGLLALLRDDPGRPWTAAEVAEIEPLAREIGRGLDHARMYQEEEELVERLRAVDRAKTSFLASASHDLQTPLTSVAGYVEMLKDGDFGPVNEAQSTALAAAERGTMRLRGLIEDMLTMSRIELGAFRSDLAPVDLTALVSAAAEAIRPAARSGGLTLDGPRSEPALLVNADAGQFERVVSNLLSNAVKYTPEGGTVSLTVTRERDKAVVRVTDNGIGIPKTEQETLFTPFFRASNALASAIPGSGLGLSIVGTIVKNHHGEIRLRSAKGEGTTVTIEIPLLGETQ